MSFQSPPHVITKYFPITICWPTSGNYVPKLINFVLDIAPCIWSTFTDVSGWLFASIIRAIHRPEGSDLHNDRTLLFNLMASGLNIISIIFPLCSVYRLLNKICVFRLRLFITVTGIILTVSSYLMVSWRLVRHPYVQQPRTFSQERKESG